MQQLAHDLQRFARQLALRLPSLVSLQSSFVLEHVQARMLGMSAVVQVSDKEAR